MVRILIARVNPVHVRHDDVGDEHVRLQRSRDFYCLFAAIDCCCLKTALVQNNGQRIRDDSLVIGDQNFGLYLIVRHSLLFAQRRASTVAPRGSA